MANALSDGDDHVCPSWGTATRPPHRLVFFAFMYLKADVEPCLSWQGGGGVSGLAAETLRPAACSSAIRISDSPTPPARRAAIGHWWGAGPGPPPEPRCPSDGPRQLATRAGPDPSGHHTGGWGARFRWLLFANNLASVPAVRFLAIASPVWPLPSVLIPHFSFPSSCSPQRPIPCRLFSSHHRLHRPPHGACRCVIAPSA